MYFKASVIKQTATEGYRYQDCVCVKADSKAEATVLAKLEAEAMLRADGFTEGTVNVLSCEECSAFLYEAYLYVYGKKDQFDQSVISGRRTA